MNLQDMIRANNQVWTLLYYDEVIEEKDYQLTFFKNADKLFYNAAQAISYLDENTIEKIKKNYVERSLLPAFYLDPMTPKNVVPQLLASGFKESIENDENWYRYDISQLHKMTPTSDDLEVKRINVFDTKEFEDFVRVNSEANDLPIIVEQQLRHHLIHRRHEKAKVEFFVAYIDGQPVGTMGIGLHGNSGYIMEVATDINFRRRGIFAGILPKCLKYAEQQGIQAIYVNCDPTAFSNQAFMKMGFEFYFSRQFYL